MATSHAGRHPNISTATTSPHSPEVEEGRIIVIEIGSSEVVEGRAIPWRQEVPPPVQCEALTPSEEYNLLSEAPG